MFLTYLYSYPTNDFKSKFTLMCPVWKVTLQFNKHSNINYAMYLRCLLNKRGYFCCVALQLSYPHIKQKYTLLVSDHTHHKHITLQIVKL